MKKVFVLLLVALGLLSLVTGCSSQPDPGTWYPNFDEGQRVQVDPSMKYEGNLPAELKKVVEATAIKHNVAIYAVVVREGDRGDDTATKLLNRMLPKWKNARGFPRDSHVVLVWLGDKDNSAHGSMAIAVGEHVQRMGVKASELDEVCKASADTDPAKAIEKALTNLSGQIEKPAEATSVGWLAIGILIIVGVIFLVGLLLAIGSGDPWMFLWFLIIFQGFGDGGGGSIGGGGSW